MNLTFKHYVALGMVLSGLGALGANLNTWNEAFQPGFVFPALGVIGGVFVAIFSEKPKE